MRNLKGKWMNAEAGTVRGTGKNQRHTAVESKIVKSVLLIAANSRVVFGKGKRMHTDLIAAPPELRQDV